MRAPHLNIAKTAICLLATLASSASMAVSLARPTLTAPNSDWTLTVAPYLWAINMDGQVTVGRHRAHVDESFDEILQHLNFAGMVWLDASKEDFGVFLNLVYAVLRYNTNDGIASIHAKNRYGITSGGLSYQIYKNSMLGISPYVGFRYTENDTTVTVNAGTLDVTVLNNQYWTDPIVGARANLAIAKAWSAIVAADIGGTNASNHYSYNVQALLGYSPQSHLTDTTLYLGYRLLDQHYTDGAGNKYYGWNMKLYGPMVGVAIKF